MKTFKQFLNEVKKIKKYKQKEKSDRSHHFHWDLDDLEHHDKKDRSHHFHWDLDDLEHHDKKINEEFGGSYGKPIKKTASANNIKQFESSHKTLKKQHYNAIGDYKDGSDYLNHELRSSGKKGPDHYKKTVRELNDDTDNEVKHLDHITNHKITHPISVYRGVHKKSTDPKKLKVGDTFTDHSYTSTSFDHKVAADFGHYGTTPNSNGKKIPHIFHIHLNKGDKGNFLDHPHIVKKTSNDIYAHEKEVLLPRGTTYKVLGHEHVNDEHGPRHVVHIKPVAYRKD